jgi:hypothetical protein
MKRCAYCGRENADHATHCCECGTADLRSADDAIAKAQAERVNPHREQSIPAWLMEKIGILSPGSDRTFVTLVTCQTLAEADLIVSDLEGAGIQAFVPDQFAMQNFSLPGILGYVRVQVAPTDYAAAKEFLSAAVVNESSG